MENFVIGPVTAKYLAIYRELNEIAERVTEIVNGVEVTDEINDNYEEFLTSIAKAQEGVLQVATANMHLNLESSLHQKESVVI